MSELIWEVEYVTQDADVKTIEVLGRNELTVIAHVMLTYKPLRIISVEEVFLVT